MPLAFRFPKDNFSFRYQPIRLEGIGNRANPIRVRRVVIVRIPVVVDIREVRARRYRTKPPVRTLQKLPYTSFSSFLGLRFRNLFADLRTPLTITIIASISCEI